jgi:ABC-type Fe3+-citrate transport system substrate-binding protein
MRVGWKRLLNATRSNAAKQEDAMSFYEAARKVQKQREMEKYLEDMRKAMAQLERMIQDGEIH